MHGNTNVKLPSTKQYDTEGRDVDLVTIFIHYFFSRKDRKLNK